MSRIIYKSDAELAAMLHKAQGPATLLSSTILPRVQKSRATGEPFENVFPSEVMQTKREFVFLGADYERLVQRRQEREGQAPAFAAQTLSWGAWVDGSKTVISHKGGLYLRYYVKLAANYAASDKVIHFEDGAELTDADLELFKQYAAKRQSDARVAQRQGLTDSDDAIHPRTVKMAGIVAVKTGGRVYVRRGYAREVDL